MEFIERLTGDVPVYPVNPEIARLAGKILGRETAKGLQFALADLLIGATALDLGYAVATLNMRDFERLPGLAVVKLQRKQYCNRVGLALADGLGMNRQAINLREALLHAVFHSRSNVMHFGDG